MKLKHPRILIGLSGIALIITAIGIIHILPCQEHYKLGAWLTEVATLNGRPLHLQYPVLPKIGTEKARFPLLLSMTQPLQTGLEDPDYRDFFDERIANLFAGGSESLVLIETFGRKKIWYFYIAENAPIDQAKLEISKSFGTTNQMIWEVKRDPEWTFLLRYARRFKLQNEG